MPALARITVLLALLGATSSVTPAQNRTPPPDVQPQTPNEDGAAQALRKASENLFKALEAQQKRGRVEPGPSQPSATPQPADPAKPQEFDCPIKVFRADPSIDPKIVVPAPENTESFKIRRIPTPCK